MRVAVLDMGTNTFNLVVAETVPSGTFRILHNQKLPVKLGEGKINHGEIIPEAFERGLQAVDTHFKNIQKFNAERIKVFGTSALRTAGNGALFIQNIRDKTGLDVELISGDREAELIYLGVRQTLMLNSDKVLILDIGGGSNEFIIADGQKIFWKKSYDLGIARLLAKFKPTDPIHETQVQEIRNYLDDELSDLIEISSSFRVNTLVGASGSFETFKTMIQGIEVVETEDAKEAASFPISLAEFDQLYQKLIRSTHEERTQMKGLEPMRLEMIVLASLFVKFIADKLNLNQIIQSNFALKEGAIAELTN